MEINIHYVERYKQLQAEFPKKKENYLTYLTTTKIFTPILYAVLTTALAFLSLIFCDIKPVIDFGWMMTLGLFISLFVSMILLPYLILKKKYPIIGPLSPDTSFLQRAKLKIDVLIGHYHDQILTTFKTKFNYDAINITIGLPFIRISPDHGVGTEIIGKGIADPKSFKKAIKFFSKYNV